MGICSKCGAANDRDAELCVNCESILNGSASGGAEPTKAQASAEPSLANGANGANGDDAKTAQANGGGAETAQASGGGAEPTKAQESAETTKAQAGAAPTLANGGDAKTAQTNGGDAEPTQAAVKPTQANGGGAKPAQTGAKPVKAGIKPAVPLIAKKSSKHVGLIAALIAISLAFVGTGTALVLSLANGWQLFSESTTTEAATTHSEQQTETTTPAETTTTTTTTTQTTTTAAAEGSTDLGTMPVAYVGDMAIEQYEFAYFMNLARQYSYYGDDEQLRENALQLAIDIKIHASIATELGVDLTLDDELTIDNIIGEMIPYYAEMMGMSVDDYVLESFGVTLEQYQELMMTMMLNDRLTYSLLEEIEVSTEEAQARYNEDPGDFNEVTVRHVLFFFEGIDPDFPRAQEESQAMAEDVLRRVQDGEDIGTLAAELTEDTGSAATEGEYIFTQNDPFVDSFKEWAFAAEVGDTGIVESEYGYHVMQLDAKRMSFDELEEEVAMNLKQDAVMAMYDTWREDPMYQLEVNEEVFHGFV